MHVKSLLTSEQAWTNCYRKTPTPLIQRYVSRTWNVRFFFCSLTKASFTCNVSEIWRYIYQQNLRQYFLDFWLLFSWRCGDMLRKNLSPDIWFLKRKPNRVLIVSRVNWVMWHYSSAYTRTLNSYRRNLSRILRPITCTLEVSPVGQPFFSAWFFFKTRCVSGVQIPVWDLGQISRFHHSNALLPDMREINFKIDKRTPNELRDKQQSITSFYLQFCTSWSLDGQASKCGGRTIGSLGCG